MDTKFNYEIHHGEATIIGLTDTNTDTIDLIIPNTIKDNGMIYPITIINNNAFDKLNIVSVMLPRKLKHIGAHAFAQNQITQIQLPHTLQSIGEGAFQKK